MNLSSVSLPKPLLRGWSHGVAALVAVAGLVALIVITRHDPAKLVSMTIYGTGLVLLFSVSATYHIFNWPPRVKDWLRRADHATIFVFIAATYTPLVFNVLDGWWRIWVLVAIWVCALAGVVGAAPFLRIPRTALAALYLSMGWVAVIALVPLTAALGWAAAVLMALAGLQYSLGAAAYAFRRPRLWPRVFGYHELFHLAVITASVTFYAIVVYYAVPYHRSS
jgi:hemolysin III